MIERLVGTIVESDDKSITLLANGIGFGVQVADPAAFSRDATCTVFTYTHWSQDKGVSLYGFAHELARSVFCLIITCPKVGPAIALALLRQLSPERIVQDIATNNEAGLSSCVGIGPKKAQQIIYALKDKVGALVAQSSTLRDSSAADWQHVQEALASLNYSRNEIADAVAHLTEMYKDTQTPALNVLLRNALAYLSAPR